MPTFLIALFVIFVLWTAYGYFASRVEQAEYTVVTEKDGYEIRRYAPHLVAQTTVQGTYTDALNNGFRIIASYIFGNNVATRKVAMTTPVTEQVSENIAMTVPVTEQQAEKVAMTAPVTAEMREGERVISFVMPREYTRDTLPTPNDPRVQIVEVPEETMAALRFSWYRSAERVERKKAELLSLLERDGMQVIGTPMFAGYNAPWTPPWMVRNEILVRVEL